MSSLHETYGRNAVSALQDVLHARCNIRSSEIGVIHIQNKGLPDHFDIRTNSAGNGKIVVDTRTGNEINVGLCDWHGFVKAVSFLEGEE